VDVGEERKKAEDGDDLELQLVASMGHALRHGVQPKEYAAEHQNGEQQNYPRYYHEHVCFTGRGDVRRQMVGSSRMKLIHAPLLSGIVFQDTLGVASVHMRFPGERYSVDQPWLTMIDWPTRSNGGCFPAGDGLDPPTRL